MTTVELTLSRDLSPAEIDQLRLLLKDVFGEFIDTRENVEAYVAKRYPKEKLTWRAEKVKEVKARREMARLLERADVFVK